MADVKPCFRIAMVHRDTAEMCQPRSGRVVALNTQPYQAINRIVWCLDLLKLSLHNQAALVNCVQQLNLHHKRTGLLAKARLVRATAPCIEVKSLMHNSERVRVQSVHCGVKIGLGAVPGTTAWGLVSWCTCCAVLENYHVPAIGYIRCLFNCKPQYTD